MASGEPAAGTFRSAWRHREWRYLLASFAVSGSGDWLYSVALVVYVAERGGTRWVAAAAVARMVPYVVLGPIGGVIADRYDKRRVMVTFDLVRAVLMVLLALVAAADGPLLAVIGISVVAAAASTPYRPAVVSATPLVVPEDDLAAANAAEGVVGELTWFVGPVLGAVLVGVGSPALAFGVNGLTFVVSALLVLHVRVRSVRVGDAGAATSLLADVRAGVAAARRTPFVPAHTVVMVAVMFVFGMELVLQVLVAQDRLGLGAAGVGYLTASIGIGGLLAAPASSRLAASGRLGALLMASTLVLVLPLAALAFVTQPGVAYALMLVEGVGNITFEVVAITMLQRLVAGAELARVFSLQDSVTALTQLGGSLVAPLVVSIASLEAALVTAGAVAVVACAVAGPSLLRADGTLAARRAAVGPRVAVLRELALLEGSGEATLERLAAAVREEHVAAGTVVLREGDAADDLFVVREGAFAVSARGVPLPEMGAGDWFGEIGILERMPRTATVTAASGAVVWRIDGQAFFDALETLPALPDPLRRGIGVRLARTTGVTS